jgi:hypothetical protein
VKRESNAFSEAYGAPNSGSLERIPPKRTVFTRETIQRIKRNFYNKTVS